MSDRLEDFIKNKRQDFDLYEPGPEVWEGLEKKIDQRKHFRLPGKQVIWQAAAVVFLFGGSLLVHEWIHRSETRVATTQPCNISIPEVEEAEVYYSGLVNNKMQQLQSQLKDHPELTNDLKKDLNELDSVYLSLKSDLADNAANKEIIEAMIQNYRLKLEILEDLLQQVKKEKKNEKKTTHKVEL